MPGVVSRRVGCEVMMEKRTAEGGLGTVEVVIWGGGGLCLLGG